MKTTLYQKIFDSHLIYEDKNTTPIIYIDLHLIHEVTSPQAFDGLRLKKRLVRNPLKTFATMDHNVSTISRKISDSKKMAKIQMRTLIKNCKDFNIPLYDLKNINQGIVHVIGPEQGMTLPGMTVVCGDSHTSTHGAFGALAFGIGTSEVEHVFATQTILQNRMKNMRISIYGNIKKNIFSKDIILNIINKIGTSGGTGYVVEFSGSVIKKMSMESRMTICNMAIEMGAKSGIIEPDAITYNYLKNKNFVPKNRSWKEYIRKWNNLKSGPKSFFEQDFSINISHISPQITWGTNPSQVIPINGKIPILKDIQDVNVREDTERSLEYMGLKPGTSLLNIPVDKVFIGSCTNSRIEDLRVVASVVQNKKISDNIEALIVPGSGLVKKQAEKEGLDKIFKNAGFQWRHAGCSMCLGMNEDQLKPYERCASTSNRNFEGRQGPKGRTHLMSPWLAAQTALYGKFVHIA
ncbi:3-isopropylmalate dehydratase large subunit [Buchnera aphidicola]|uniref:3-isopropylmalate dehydratase large subunit n=1 Tax=Buchnera aphidicola subsp. Cinara cedri (strain Cc) TaxID=372461 RepID=LEUC_BUCCC|nr:3-isopropylmalate dehydratase large subunit [Buchnera aphidicola]Q5WPZ8.1 RecName: Full=3-isopropylmalate dehydratase large subunit; AltName: Full=Alpha-IPM isomerase; Short=IPMI; AltName: Full=Isopropylmalate isomerase [Buchnera aphidicola BCc]AAR99735.1 3-isopropylmalate dehydratase large subunit [Buchnera aphidicola BCc]